MSRDGEDQFRILMFKTEPAPIIWDHCQAIAKMDDKGQHGDIHIQWIKQIIGWKNIWKLRMIKKLRLFYYFLIILIIL